MKKIFLVLFVPLLLCSSACAPAPVPSAIESEGSKGLQDEIRELQASSKELESNLRESFTKQKELWISTSETLKSIEDSTVDDVTKRRIQKLRKTIDDYAKTLKPK